jgi:hypothetical protein
MCSSVVCWLLVVVQRIDRYAFGIPSTIHLYAKSILALKYVILLSLSLSLSLLYVCRSLLIWFSFGV